MVAGAFGPMPTAKSSSWRSYCPNVSMSAVDLVLADKWEFKHISQNIKSSTQQHTGQPTT